MAMSERNGHLPCGVDVGDLVDQVAEHRPPADRGHQEACPYCRAALEELEPLWAEVRELAQEEVTPPGGMLTSVMRRVRRERLPRPGLPLERVVPRLVSHAQLRGPRGSTKIADSVIAKLIERAALDTPGVRSLRRPDPLGRGEGLALVVEHDEVSVEIGLVIEYGVAIPALVADVRARLEREVERFAGVRLVSVEVVAVDVHDDR